MLCPTTHNYVNWKFLYGLHDISKLRSYDLALLCIDHLMDETENHHNWLWEMNLDKMSETMYVGGCLPLIAVLFMDFLDLNIATRKHCIDSNLPRIIHI